MTFLRRCERLWGDIICLYYNLTIENASRFLRRIPRLFALPLVILFTIFWIVLAMPIGLLIFVTMFLIIATGHLVQEFNSQSGDVMSIGDILFCALDGITQVILHLIALIILVGICLVDFRQNLRYNEGVNKLRYPNV